MNVHFNKTSVVITTELETDLEKQEIIKLVEKFNNQLKKALINPKPSKFKQLSLWQKS